MLNLLAITGSKAEAHQFVLIARVLIKNGIKMHLATSRPMVYDYIKQDMSWNYINYFPIKKLSKPTMAEDKVLLKKYTKPNIAEMLSSEQIISHWKINHQYNLLTKFISDFEQLFKKEKIDVLIKYPTCSLIGRTAFSVANANKKKTLIVNTGPIVTEIFTLNDIDEGWLWSEFFEHYNATDFEVNQEIIEEVSKIVEKVISDKKKSISIKKLNIKSTIYHLALFLYQKIKRINDPIQYNEVKKELLFAFGRYKISPKYFKLNKKLKYVFFPLHIPWDAQIATRNPMFYSQEAIVEMLSRCLPPNYTLYIKEHPYYCGGVNRKMLSRFKNYKNIKILDPSTSSLEIIENSQAVVTINSTAGWESIIMKKPLIVLGNPYYAYFRGALKVENINSLPEIVNKALSQNDDYYKINVKDWNHFIYSAVKSSFKGSMILYKNYMGLGAKINNDRIVLLSKEIEKKIKTIVN